MHWANIELGNQLKAPKMSNEKKFEDLTNNDCKELKVEFAPGCFDQFDGTQEELDELIAEIQKMVASGNILENSRALSDEDFDELPDEVKEQLLSFDPESEELSTNIKRNLQ
jgi:hypothetical protein